MVAVFFVWLTGAGEQLPPVNNTLPTPLPQPLPQTGLALAPSRDSFLPPPTRLPSMPAMPPAVGLPGGWPPPAPASAPVGMPMPLRSSLSMGVHRGVGLPKLGVFPPPPAASAPLMSEASPVGLPTGPSMAYAHRQPLVMTPAAPPAGLTPLGSRSSLPLPLPLSNPAASAAAPSPVVGGHPLMRPPSSHSLDRPVEGARPMEDRRPGARADAHVGVPASSRPRVPDKALPVIPAVAPPRRSVAPRSEAEERRDLGAKEAIKAAKKRDHRPPMPGRASHGQAGVAVASADPGRKGGSSRARTPLGAAAVANAPPAPAALPPRPPASAGTSADPAVDGSKATDAAPAVTAPSPTVPRKPRKPYTITKARECWSAEEHHRFLRALELYSRDWKRIEAHVRTKTVLQIRSHAQKHFYKVQKNKTGEYVPPARIKRRPNSVSAGASTPASAAASGAGNDSVPAVGCSTSSYDATAVTGDAGLARTGGSPPNERTRGRGAIGSGASGGVAAATTAAATPAASATDPASGTAAEGHSGEGRPFGDSGTDRTRNAAGRQLSSSGDDGGSGRSNNSQTYQPNKEGGPAAGTDAIMVNAAAKAGVQPGGVVNGAGNGVANGAEATVDPFVAGAAAAAAAAAATASASASGSIPPPFGPYPHVPGVPSTAMAGALSAHSAWLAAAQARQSVTPSAMPGVAPHLCPPPMYGAGGPNMYCMPPPWMPSYPPPPGPPGGGFPMYPMAWPQYYPHPAMAAVMAAAAYGSPQTPGLPLSSGGVGVPAPAQAPFVSDNPAASQLEASVAGPVGAPDLPQQPHVDRGAAAVGTAGVQAPRLDATPALAPVEAGGLPNGAADGFPVGVPAEGWATAAASRRAHRARVLRSVKSRAAAAGGGTDEALEPSVPVQDAGASAHDGGAGRRPRGPMPSAGAYFGAGAAAGTAGATGREAAVAAAAQRSAAAAADDSGRDSMDGIGSGSGSGGDSLIGSHTSAEAAPGGSDDTAQGGRDDPPSDGVFGRSSSPPSAVAPPRSSPPVDGQPSGVPLGTGSPDILARAVGAARHDHGSDGSGTPGGRAGQSSSGQRGGGSSDPASGGSTYAGSSRGNSREMASPGIGGPRPPAGPGAPRGGGGGGGSGSDDVGAGVCGGSVGGSGGGTPPGGSEAGSPLCGKRPREAGADGACGGAGRRPPLSPQFHKPHAAARPDTRRERLAISWAALQQERDKADAARGRPGPVVPAEAEHVPDSQLPTGALPYQLENRRAMR